MIEYPAVVVLISQRDLSGSGIARVAESFCILIPGGARISGSLDPVGKVFSGQDVDDPKHAPLVSLFRIAVREEAPVGVGDLTESVCKRCWCFRYCIICAKKAEVGADELSAEAKHLSCEKARNMAYGILRQYV